MDVMIDIETIGIRPGCAILSIGAVGFERATGNVLREFYSTIDLRASIAQGATIDAGTLHWWLSQSAEARASAFVEDEFRDPKSVLTRFAEWMHEVRPDAVWSHGLTFDLPILEAAYDKINLAAPWFFWAARDTRTVYDILHFDPKCIDREGTYHNALDDAKHQVKCLHSAMCGLVDGIE